MPKGPRKLVITFGNQTLTHYGGVYLLHRFLTRIGLKNAIATEIRLIQRNNCYTVGELLLAILYPIILGLERIETTQLLQHNGVFRYLSGLPAYPDPSTLRRFLVRMAPQALTRLHDRGVAGGVQSSVGHRCQTHPTYQTQAGSPEIRLGQYRSANSRILLSASSLVPSLPLRGYSTTSTRRVRATADVVQAREVPLSNPGYQSRSEARQPLALLQWSSRNRTDYPRAQGRLPFGQDPYPSLLCQRRLLSSIALGLQLSELVQAAVFAPGVSGRYARYVAQSHSVNACTTASDRQSAPTGYARRWPTGKRLEACVA